MKNKIKLANELLKNKSIKAKDLESIEIENLIFSLNNVEKHYITTYDGMVWYCYKVYECGLPENDLEIKDYCSRNNLYRSLHDNDYKRRIRLVSGTELAIKNLIEYLNNKGTRTHKG